MAPITGYRPIASRQTVESVRNALNAMFSDLYGYDRNVKDWGVLPSASGETNTTAMNSAIQDAMSSGFGLKIDPGYYNFDGMILMARIEGGQWSARQLPTIRSSVYCPFPNNSTVPNYAFPVLRATFDDAPLIAIQAGKGAALSGLQLLGNINPTLNASYAAATLIQKLSDISLWNNGQRQGRWSPASVVAIDPFGTGVPSGSRYPGVPTSYYTMTDGFTTGTTISNCILSQSEVALLIGCGVSQNTDGVTVNDCQFSNSTYAISTCHAQTKNVVVSNISLATIFAMLTSNTHGALNGFNPQVFGINNASGIGTLFRQLHPGSPVILQGGHVEVICGIGDFGPAVGTSEPVSIQYLSTIMLTATGSLPHLKSGRPMNVSNCALSCEDGPVRIAVDSSVGLPGTWDTSGYASGPLAGAELVFSNTKFSGAGRTTKAQTIVVTSGSDKDWCRFDNCFGDYSDPYTGLYSPIHGRAGTLGF